MYVCITWKKTNWFPCTAGQKALFRCNLLTIPGIKWLLPQTPTLTSSWKGQITDYSICVFFPLFPQARLKTNILGPIDLARTNLKRICLGPSAKSRENHIIFTCKLNTKTSPNISEIGQLWDNWSWITNITVKGGLSDKVIFYTILLSFLTNLPLSFEVIYHYFFSITIILQYKRIIFFQVWANMAF